jgi:hypothetical protein
LDSGCEASRRHPSDPVSGREGFGKRAAVEDQPFAVECLDRFGALAAEKQLGIDIILDQRDVVFVQKARDVTFLVLRRERAERILKGCHQPAGPHRMALQRPGENADIDAVPGMRRDLQRPQAQRLDGLQAGIECRGFDRDDVTRTGQDLQAQIESLERAGGDDDLLGRDPHAGAQVATRNLAA